jgi:hypothetical protein
VLQAEVLFDPRSHPYADMMEPGDMLVLETSAAMRAGSTPAIGTLPLSSKDRMSGYEPEATEQSEGCE